MPCHRQYIWDQKYLVGCQRLIQHTISVLYRQVTCSISADEKIICTLVPTDIRYFLLNFGSMGFITYAPYQIRNLSVPGTHKDYSNIIYFRFVWLVWNMTRYLTYTYQCFCWSVYCYKTASKVRNHELKVQRVKAELWQHNTAQPNTHLTCIYIIFWVYYTRGKESIVSTDHLV